MGFKSFIIIGVIVVAIPLSLTVFSALDSIEKSRSGATVAYERIYCNRKYNGEDVWWGAREYLMHRRPESLNCSFVTESNAHDN